MVVGLSGSIVVGKFGEAAIGLHTLTTVSDIGRDSIGGGFGTLGYVIATGTVEWVFISETVVH